MKISCTGPHGERFEGETGQWRGNPEDVGRVLREDRMAMQAALETWCKTVDANIKDAKTTL